MRRTAVVILNWNGQKMLEKYLPSVVLHSNIENVEIWVADNGSTDNSIKFLQTHYPTVKILQLSENYGFAGGYNKALEQIEADYFVLLNSDVEVTENWIYPVIDFMEANPEIAAVQPKIKSWVEKSKFEYAGAAGGFIDKFGYPFCRGRILDTVETDEGQYNEAKEIFWATGACLFIKSKDFWENKFDEDFFAHMEEIDLCWRLQNKNRKIFVFPEVEVYHLGGGTLNYNNPRKLKLNFRNNLYLLYKNLPSEKLFGVMLKRMILDGIAAMMFLAKFEFSNFTAVFKAHLEFYKNLKKLKQKRIELQDNSFDAYKKVYKKSIIFDYYFRKKRKFTQLNF